MPSKTQPGQQDKAIEMRHTVIWIPPQSLPPPSQGQVNQKPPVWDTKCWSRGHFGLTKYKHPSFYTMCRSSRPPSELPRTVCSAQASAFKDHPKSKPSSPWWYICVYIYIYIYNVGKICRTLLKTNCKWSGRGKVEIQLFFIIVGNSWDLAEWNC